MTDLNDIVRSSMLRQENAQLSRTVKNQRTEIEGLRNYTNRLNKWRRFWMWLSIFLVVGQGVLLLLEAL